MEYSMMLLLLNKNHTMPHGGSLRDNRAGAEFDAFKQSGDIFNPEYAAKFRTLLEKCSSDDGMIIYKNLRGQEPSKEPLLRKRGLK